MTAAVSLAVAAAPPAPGSTRNANGAALTWEQVRAAGARLQLTPGASALVYLPQRLFPAGPSVDDVNAGSPVRWRALSAEDAAAAGLSAGAEPGTWVELHLLPAAAQGQSDRVRLGELGWVTLVAGPALSAREFAEAFGPLVADRYSGTPGPLFLAGPPPGVEAFPSAQDGDATLYLYGDRLLLADLDAMPTGTLWMDLGPARQGSYGPDGRLAYLDPLSLTQAPYPMALSFQGFELQALRPLGAGAVAVAGRLDANTSFEATVREDGVDMRFGRVVAGAPYVGPTHPMRTEHLHALADALRAEAARGGAQAQALCDAAAKLELWSSLRNAQEPDSEAGRRITAGEARAALAADGDVDEFDRQAAASVVQGQRPSEGERAGHPAGYRQLQEEWGLPGELGSRYRLGEPHEEGDQVVFPSDDGRGSLRVPASASSGVGPCLVDEHGHEVRLSSRQRRELAEDLARAGQLELAAAVAPSA